MSNPIRVFLTTVTVMLLCGLSVSAQAVKPVNTSATPTLTTPPSQSDREQDGLQGPVRKIKTEVSKLITNGGRPAEGPRVMLESTAYDNAGKKVDTAYYPVSGGALTGRETYKYDAQGNISEMTLLNADGSVLAKEVYRYEYDFVGNWITMTTAVAVIEGGKLTYDPTEVTHRTISYYMDEKLTRLMEASQKPATAPVPPGTAPTNAASNTVPLTTQPKPAPAGNSPTDTSGAQNMAANHVMENKPVETKPNDTSSTVGANPPNSNPVNKPANNAANNSTAETKPEPVAAPPAPKPITKPVSGGVLNGSAISLPPPRYPEIARRSRAGGLVVIEVVIDETGKVISAKAVDGPAIFFNEAIEAAKRAKFSPTKLSGVPVKVTGMIKYNFSVDN